MGRVDGMVALVTGSSRGIGRAIAIALAKEGADVAVNYFNSEKAATEVVQAINDVGRKALLIRADVSKVTEIKRMVQETIEHFSRIDILVNNAGGGNYQQFEDISEAEYDEILNLHLKGPFFAAQAAVPYMRAQGRGRIINIGSEQAYIGYPILSHYTAAKGGILTLTKSLALALSPTINVNTVSPGPIATEALMAGPEYVDEIRDQIPLKRWGQPEDVARTVVFLASSDGDFFTGQTLDPNGGTVMP
jgi:NAD(P)-dependent dehydrogenase (short-subunit alcohol dehydrogenase family)